MAFRLTSLAIASAMSLGAFAGHAAAQSTAEQYAAQCIRATHARGEYVVVMDRAIPQVVAGNGATIRGVSDVNDCLADKYQVQPGSRAVAAAAPAAVTPNGRQLNCRRILSRSPGGAAAASFGTSILAGAIGASIQAGVYQRNLQTCLARYGGANHAAPLAAGCAPGEAIVGGTRYCTGS